MLKTENFLELPFERKHLAVRPEDVLIRPLPDRSQSLVLGTHLRCKGQLQGFLVISVQILILLLGQIEIVHHSKLVGLIGLGRESSTGLQCLHLRDSFVRI